LGEVLLHVGWEGLRRRYRFGFGAPRDRRRADASGSKSDRSGFDAALGEATQDFGAEQRQLLSPDRRLHDDGEHAVAQRTRQRASGNSLAHHFDPRHAIDGEARPASHRFVRRREQRAHELRLALGFAATGCRPAGHQLGIS
jgi:hypothetical protein